MIKIGSHSGMAGGCLQQQPNPQLGKQA
jgi:hypothetical protein